MTVKLFGPWVQSSIRDMPQFILLLTPFLDQCTPAELADLLQQAYAADHDLPGDHLTDSETRHALARTLDQNERLKDQVVDAWLQDQWDLEDPLMYWLDAEFLGLLDA